MFKRINKTEGDSMNKGRALRKIINVMVIAAMVLTMVVPAAMPSDAASPKLQASAYVKVKKGAVIRKSVSLKGKTVKKLKYNSKLIIYHEVFTSKTNPKAVNKWYYVASGSKRGFIRSDMVKNVKYTTKKAYTTDDLYYRVGVGKKMKRKGMFKKGASVNVVIPAYLKGSKEKWYKVKVGKNYYYSCATWIKLGTKPKKTTTKKSSSSTTKPASSSTSNTSSTSGGNKIADYTYPTTIGSGCPFSLKGKVTSGGIIETASVAIQKSNVKNAIFVEKEVNGKTFNISSVDAEIKFGTLAAGTYKYIVKIRVDGKSYTMLNKSFTVVNSKKAKLITNKAFELAWAPGTPDKKYEYKTGKPTAAYKKALNQVYPNRSRWGAAPRVGASCDVFVGTVLRASGVDTQVPRGLDDQMKYYAKSSRWKRISYNGNKSVLRSGDVIILQRPGNGGAHTFIYVSKNGKTYLAEAGYKQMYGRVCSGGTRDYQLQAKKGRKFYVYRIID